MAAAPAFDLLDVAGAAESESHADHVIVVKCQQTQHLTKDLLKTVYAHGFSILRKLRVTSDDARCDRKGGSTVAKVAQVPVAGHPWTNRCF